MQEDVLFQLTNGLYIISAPHKEKKGTYAGSLVDAISQIAINPYLLALSCMNNSYTKECIENYGYFGVSILSREISPYTIANFGFQSSRNANKWKNVAHQIKHELSFLSDSLGNIKANVIQTLKYPCNTLFIAEIEETFGYQAGIPLTYAHYRNDLKTKVIEAWKNNQQEKPEMTNNNEQKHWVCTICGYVYEEETPFEDLPDDWLCPLCGVGKEYFKYQ